MLALELTLLTGRYVATAYNDRDSAEWPPHPARVFSALTATFHSAQDPDPAERNALQWLEALGAPEIAASDASCREAYTVFVPVNDTTLLGDFGDAQHAIASGRGDLDIARGDLVAAKTKGEDGKTLKALEKVLVAAEKKLKKLEDRMREQLAKAIMPVAKPSGEDTRAARQLFPETRVRQPRTFPSVTPEDPNVTYIWASAAPTPQQRQSLSELCERVVRVGHSTSLVRLRVVETSPLSTYIPDDLGTTRFRVAITGQLARLEAQFERHQETHPRVLPALAQGYTRRRAEAHTAAHESRFDDDWLVLELVSAPHRALSMLLTVDVASAVRGALQKYCEGPIPELLSGHSSDGSPSQHPHLAIVPLPFVGAFHADGRILGVALVFPRQGDREQRRAVFQALANWESTARKTDEDTPLLPLLLGHAGEWLLRRLEDTSSRSTLRGPTWCGWARGERVWMSATPVALDRNPGDLLSRNPGIAGAAFASAEETIAIACERIGLPRPDRVWVTRSAPLAGCEKVRRFGRYPQRETKPQRVLVHATLRFADPIKGPLILGAGRYQGLGLFRPMNADLVMREECCSSESSQTV